MTGYQRLKDPSGLGRAVAIGLGIHIAITLFSMAALALELIYLEAVQMAPLSELLRDFAAPSTIDLLVMTSSLAELLAWLVVGVMSLVWIHRVNANAHGLANGMQSSSAWAVGWFFVPIALLWKPFRGIEEAWKVSHAPDRWQILDTPPLLRIWWGFWIVSGFVGNIASRMTWSAQTVEDYIASDRAMLLSALVYVPTMLLFLQIVRRLTRAQSGVIRSRREALRPGGETLPPFAGANAP